MIENRNSGALRYAAIGAMVGAAYSGRANAEPCGDVSQAVVVVGSTAIKPLLREVAKLVAASSDGPQQIYYVGKGSCVGVEAIVSGAPLDAQSLAYWDATGTELSCTVNVNRDEPDAAAPGSAELDAAAADAAAPAPAPTTAILRADIGVSDVFPGTCITLPNGLASNITDFLGPVQTMAFAVPSSSSQEVISAEAAYYVYGFGADSGVSPWTDATAILQRDAESGTQGMIAKAIGVDADRWQGLSTTGSSDMLQRLVTASSDHADATLGILSASHAEENRATVRMLAYQDFGETCGILPNRSARSNEKENVRNGSYPLWGPLHLLTTVDGNQRPAKELVATVIGYIVGSATAAAGLDLIALQAQERIVPQCAMRVKRNHEMGPALPFVPEQPCGCYYEEAANGSTACTPCQADRDCNQMQACSYGYCESLE